MERENTLILYSTNNDNTFAYEGIADVYDKNINIQVYKEDIDIENNTCIGTWANAEIVQMESLQEIEIYFIPDGFTIEEWKDVIRVTPNYEFPVKTKDNKIINKYAYLLETGDELLFEETQYNTNNDGIIDGEQKLFTRSISKILKVDLDKPKYFYNFKLSNNKDYYLLPNGNIIKSI